MLSLQCVFLKSKWMGRKVALADGLLLEKFNHFQLTETPFLGPLKEISMPLCSQETLMGGRSVKDTTQLRLSMLPMSTYMSGSPMMCVSGSATREK